MCIRDRDEGEDKQEQQRLHSHARKKYMELAEQYAQIAQEQAQEGFENNPRAADLRSPISGPRFSRAIHVSPSL